MSKEKLGILASGRGSNFQAILEHVEMGILEDVDVRVLISDNPDARALDVAEKGGIPNKVVEPKENEERKEHEKRIGEFLEENNVTLVILAGFMRIVSPYLINQYKHRIMNIHPALLPSFKGLDAQKQALEYGVKVSGCTVHYAEEEVDAGEIILQKAVPVREDDDEETLSNRILIHEHRTYPKAIQLHADGRIDVENGKTRVDYSGKWKKKWEKRQEKFIERQKEAWKGTEVFEDVFR